MTAQETAGDDLGDGERCSSSRSPPAVSRIRLAVSHQELAPAPSVRAVRVGEVMSLTPRSDPRYRCGRIAAAFAVSEFG